MKKVTQYHKQLSIQRFFIHCMRLSVSAGSVYFVTKKPNSFF